MLIANVGKSSERKSPLILVDSRAIFKSSLSIEFYRHHLNLKNLAEWLYANNYQDLGLIFRNFADEVLDDCVKIEKTFSENAIYENNKKSFDPAIEKISKAEIVRRILRQAVFETRRLKEVIKNEYENSVSDGKSMKKIKGLSRLCERQLFWLKMFLKHRSERSV